MKLLFLNTILILFLTSSTVNHHSKKQAQQSPDFSIDFEKLSPKQLIALLKIGQIKKDKLDPVRFLERAPIGWIKKTDIDYLMILITSKDTCRCLVSPLSSSMCFKCKSTIGAHAMEMISCYREEVQYPGGFTSCPVADPEKIKEIRTWWKK